MSFSTTYNDHVIQSRRDRSRRAIFWSRIVGLMLMITFAATMRSEPELRRALATAAMDGVMRVVGSQSASGNNFSSADPAASKPRDRVKVNRFGSSGGGNDAAQQTQQTADKLGQALANRRVGG